MCPILEKRIKLMAYGIFIYAIICNLSVSIASSDSIWNMINTEKVEKYLAQRRENTTKEKRLFLFHNALDDTELPSSTFVNDPPSTTERYVKPYIPTFNHLSNSPPEKPRSRTFDTHRVGIDNLIRRHNDSSPYEPNDLLTDLAGFAGNKVLKSSKNALFVTTKKYLKSDWCKTEPLVQKIKENGCLTRTVINRFCYGQCNSFYIPKNPPRRKRPRKEDDSDGMLSEIRDVAAAFKSCSFCKPRKASWITVTLFCPSMKPQVRRKRIQRIKQCKCMSEDIH